MSVVTEEQLSSYRSSGYLHLKNILPEDLLDLSRTVLNRWADETISRWLSEQLISSNYAEVDFHHRLLVAWYAAGKPNYSRSPRRDLVSPEMYQILTFPILLDLAAELLGTQEVSVHGIFNARPQTP